MKLVVAPNHWLNEDGSIPLEPLRLRRLALRVARIIEYGGPLRPLETRETLIECSRRPRNRHCPGLLWVEKLPDEALFAYCMICKQEEIHVHNWHDTEWAEGPMEPAPVHGPFALSLDSSLN